MHFTALAAEAPSLVRSGISIELVSAPGRGKSQFVRQLYEQLAREEPGDWGYAELFLATQTPPDLIGYQFKGEVEYDGKSFAVTDPTMPSWFMCEDGRPVFAYPRGILFLDEFGQGQTDVKAAAAELILNKRLGKWRLPDGWIVIAASNRSSDRSGVTKSLDFVINRRMEIHVTDDLASWEDWANKYGVHPDIVTFAMQNPEIVFSDGVPEKQGPWCTPRSLVLAEKMLRAISPGMDLRTDPSALELTAGLIGEAAAAQLMANLKLAADMPSYDEIVRAPDATPVPDKPDVQMLIAYRLAAMVQEKDLQPVITYVGRMGMEMGMLFAKATTKRKPLMINAKPFMTWCMQNSTIMAAIGKLN